LFLLKKIAFSQLFAINIFKNTAYSTNKLFLESRTNVAVKIMQQLMTQSEDYIPTILAVDDVPANLDILVEHFQNDKIHLTVALSGKDALLLANASPPDLILLDIMMPGMDGYEVCRHLKSNPHTKDIPIIFVTAMGDSENEEKGLALGAIDYITKPFVLPVLKARIRNYLELKRKTDLLAELSLLDGLTGVANRRYFDSMLDQEWNRCQRSFKPLSLIMIDVDHFKLYNDYYGHGMGDECLKKITKALRKTLKRPADLLARYGGEEFVVLLPEMNEKEAVNVAEKLCENVAGLLIPHKQSDTKSTVTISLGCASTTPKQDNTAEQLLKQADECLYAAKAQGRDKVVGCTNTNNKGSN